MEEIVIIEDLEPEEIVLLEEQIEYIKPTGEKKIIANGIYDVTDYSSANVNVPAPAPDLEDLTITPTTSEQTFNHPNKDGYDEVVVNGVTNSIDSNIQAENIKKDVSILGITGTLEAPDLNEYFNITPTAKELNNMQYWVRDNYIKKVGELIVPDNITDITSLCAGSNSTAGKNKYVPKIICNNNVAIFWGLYAYTGAKTIDTTGLDTSNATNMSSMFQYSDLINIDISTLDFLSISGDVSNVFFACNYLEKAIITPKVTKRLFQWFARCYSLKTLVLLKNDKVCEYYNTLNECYHMNGTVNSTYNPEGLRDGRIYVPDNLVNSYKTASGWKAYADQILPLSQYVE